MKNGSCKVFRKFVYGVHIDNAIYRDVTSLEKTNVKKNRDGEPIKWTYERNSHAPRRRYRALKRWFSGLPKPERAQVVAMYRKAA